MRVFLMIFEEKDPKDSRDIKDERAKKKPGPAAWLKLLKKRT